MALVVAYLLVSTVVVLPCLRWRNTQEDTKAAWLASLPEFGSEIGRSQKFEIKF